MINISVGQEIYRTNILQRGPAVPFFLGSALLHNTANHGQLDTLQVTQQGKRVKIFIRAMVAEPMYIFKLNSLWRWIRRLFSHLMVGKWKWEMIIVFRPFEHCFGTFIFLSFLFGWWLTPTPPPPHAHGRQKRKKDKGAETVFKWPENYNHLPFAFSNHQMRKKYSYPSPIAKGTWKYTLAPPPLLAWTFWLFFLVEWLVECLIDHGWLCCAKGPSPRKRGPPRCRMFAFFLLFLVWLFWVCLWEGGGETYTK